LKDIQTKVEIANFSWKIKIRPISAEEGAHFDIFVDLDRL